MRPIRSQPPKVCKNCIPCNTDSFSCVKNREVDFLISQHIQAKALRVDSADQAKKIIDLKGIINYQDNNMADYNKIKSEQKIVITGLTQEKTDLINRALKAEKRAGRRGRTIFSLIGAALIELVIILVKR